MKALKHLQRLLHCWLVGVAKKGECDLGTGRGRMISTPDRVKAIELIDEAVNSGARRTRACEELGINDRTYRRWNSGDGVRDDARPSAKRESPAHKLTIEERLDIPDTCNQPDYAHLSPAQILPRLADEGTYIGSEFTFYRVLHEAEQQHIVAAQKHHNHGVSRRATALQHPIKRGHGM